MDPKELNSKIIKFKIIHIVNNDKFINAFYNLISEKFNKDEHLFIYMFGEDEEKFKIPKENNVININNKYKRFKNFFGLFQILNIILKSKKKIIFHGLFSIDLQRALFFLSSKLNRSYWIMWGADLYAPLIQKKNMRNDINNFIGRKVKSSFSHYVTYVEGDFALAKKLYNIRGCYKECIIYPSNIYSNLSDGISRDDHNVNVLVGNSADPTNNHFDILDKIYDSKLTDEHFKIYCPLSYGDKNYSLKVIEYGKNKFGDRFVPIIDFLTLDDYKNLLSKIDFAVFGHLRQQAMGNIINLLGLEKTVYMSEKISSYSFFKSKKIKVKSIDNIDFVGLTDKEKYNNRVRIEEYFCEKKLLLQLKNIFED